jgi:hypothetical protein
VTALDDDDDDDDDIFRVEETAEGVTKVVSLLPFLNDLR